MCVWQRERVREIYFVSAVVSQACLNIPILLPLCPTVWVWVSSCFALHRKASCSHAYEQLLRLRVRGGLLRVTWRRSQSGQVEQHIFYKSQHARWVTVTGCATVANTHRKNPWGRRTVRICQSHAEHTQLQRTGKQKKIPRQKTWTKSNNPDAYNPEKLITAFTVKGKIFLFEAADK